MSSFGYPGHSAMSFQDPRFYMHQPAYDQYPPATINPSQLHQRPNEYLPAPSQVRNARNPQSQPQGQRQDRNENNVYLCLYDERSFRRKADLQRHVAITHNRESLKLVDCRQPGCHRRGDYGFTRKDKMVDHMRDVHGAQIPKKAASKDNSAASSPADA